MNHISWRLVVSNGIIEKSLDLLPLSKIKPDYNIQTAETNILIRETT